MTPGPSGPTAPPPVRPAEPDDLEAIHEIYSHHVRHGVASFELEPPDLATLTRRYEAVVAHGLPYLVAVPDGRVRAYAYASPYHTRPGYRFSVEDSVYVAPGWEGRSLGRALLVPVIEHCEAQGYRRMVGIIATAGDGGKGASIRLHESLGFALVGCLPAVGFKFGRWIDTVILQRPLGEGDKTLPD